MAKEWAATNGAVTQGHCPPRRHFFSGPSASPRRPLPTAWYFFLDLAWIGSNQILNRQRSLTYVLRLVCEPMFYLFWGDSWCILGSTAEITFTYFIFLIFIYFFIWLHQILMKHAIASCSMQVLCWVLRALSAQHMDSLDVGHWLSSGGTWV